MMPPRNPTIYRFLAHPLQLLRQAPVAKNQAHLPPNLTIKHPTTTTTNPPTLNTWSRQFSSIRNLGSRPAIRPWCRQARPSRRFNSSRQNTNNNKSSSTEPASLSQRLRKLSREYGWSALGVYLLLSALDFPLCFAAVRYFGSERIGHLEHVIVGSVKEAFYALWPGHRTETESTTGDQHAETASGESGHESGKNGKSKGEASMLFHFPRFFFHIT